MKFGAGGLYSETQAEREAKLGRSRTTHGFSEARNWWRRARRPWARMQRLGRRPAGRSPAALDLTPTATRRLPTSPPADDLPAAADAKQEDRPPVESTTSARATRTKNPRTMGSKQMGLRLAQQRCRFITID